MCEIDFSEGEPVTGYRTKTRKARKPHRCDCCRGPIETGSTYLYASWLHEREPDSEKQCAACAADNREFASAHGVYLFGSEFYNYLHECVVNPDEDGDDEDSKRWRPMLERLDARIAAAKAAEAAA